MLASVMAFVIVIFSLQWKIFRNDENISFLSKKKKFSFKLPVLFLHLKKKKLVYFIYFFLLIIPSFHYVSKSYQSVTVNFFFYYYYLHDLFLVYELDHWLEKNWPLARVPKICCSSIHATCMWFYSFILFNNFFFLWRK